MKYVQLRLCVDQVLCVRVQTYVYQVLYVRSQTFEYIVKSIGLEQCYNFKLQSWSNSWQSCVNRSSSSR